MCEYSIIVPAYNEEKALQLFYDAITPVMESTGESYELIFINDGSTDETKTILDRLTQTDKRVKACHFSRNFGQQSALFCGLQKSSGNAVIAMDADLQDPPEVALQMIEKWKEGYQIVHGKRNKRKGETAFKRGTASLFYKLTRKLTGLDVPQNTGDFKLYDRQVVGALLSLTERDKLLRVQTAWIGFKQTFVTFDRPERIAGETHYTVKKMVKLAKAGIFPNTEFTLSFPLKLGLCLGFLSVACFALFMILSGCGVYFGGLTAWLFPSLGLGVSIVTICQGVSNIHLNMVYKEVQNRPQYIIAEEKNFGEYEC